ncbi:alpha/beta hydrolase [Mesorhizobium sp. L-8-3]|uniref:alpha/beta hydrolase n=1 Tax=Mesorhizobium sp. L-8-3 TaxID=2744522 RepID=UPI001928BCFF|nr:alpha/beta hydrolase [Mesorhizobium sp. L-8-3]BCH20786.1 alpha/beta hydrolase [Mesorhizobium sp. L-8-3]
MLDPQLEAFLETWNGSWTVLPAGATPRERRILFEYIANDMALPRPEGVRTSARFVPSGGRLVPVRVDRFDCSGQQPCLVYMHGGAWMQGSPMTHADITMRIAAANCQTVISVDYALAPEYPFPRAANECRDAFAWVRDHAAELGIDPVRIAIGGDSAGANLAASACIALRGTSHEPLAQLLVYPCVHFEMSLPSYQENADAPLLQTKGMPGVNAMYCPNEADRKNPLAAPLHAESHRGLPPAFVAVAQYDPLRDDGYAYADKLRAAGVPVEVDDGEGLIHGYLRAMDYCDASRQRIERMCTWLADRYAAAAQLAL